MKRIRATLATTDYVPKYGGLIRLSLEQLESMLKSLKTGKVRSSLFHDSRRPLHVENVEAGIKAAPGGAAGPASAAGSGLGAPPAARLATHDRHADQGGSHGTRLPVLALARSFNASAGVVPGLDHQDSRRHRGGHGG
jgi:hypothetical protein